MLVEEGGADTLRLSGEGLDALGYAKRAGEEGAGEVHGGVSAGKDNRPVKYTDNKQPQKFIPNLGLFNSFLSYEKKIKISDEKFIWAALSHNYEENMLITLKEQRKRRRRAGRLHSRTRPNKFRSISARFHSNLKPIKSQHKTFFLWISRKG